MAFARWVKQPHNQLVVQLDRVGTPRCGVLSGPGRTKLRNNECGGDFRLRRQKRHGQHSALSLPNFTTTHNQELTA